MADSSANGKSIVATVETLVSAVDKRVVGCILAAAAARFLWSEYGILLSKDRPAYPRFELPLLGSNLRMMWYGYVEWCRHHVFGGHQAVLTNFLGANTVIVSWPLYMSHVRRADNEGKLDQGQFPQYMIDMIGSNSMLFMRAGKGQAHHHRLRSKVLAAMSPKRILALAPFVAEVIRDELDSMVSETEAKGYSTFQSHANAIAARVSSVPIVGSLEPEVRNQLEGLFQVWVTGLLSTPVNLGSFSAFGRAVKAHARVVEMIRKLMKSPSRGQGDHTTIIGELAAASGEGTAFSEAEIVDSTFTLIFAGQLTTSEALPCILAEIAAREEWRAKCAGEPLDFKAMEEDSAALRFTREVLRHYPPEVFFFRRSLADPVDLGEHGSVPAGTNIAVNFGHHMWSMGSDFNPDRWADPSAERESFLTFGHHSPHSCVGRGLAMLELQLFCRLVAQEYDVEVLDNSRVRNWKFGGFLFQYRDGLKVRIRRAA